MASRNSLERIASTLSRKLFEIMELSCLRPRLENVVSPSCGRLLHASRAQLAALTTLSQVHLDRSARPTLITLFVNVSILSSLSKLLNNILQSIIKLYFYVSREIAEWPTKDTSIQLRFQ